jgi:hypothetical protein
MSYGDDHPRGCSDAEALRAKQKVRPDRCLIKGDLSDVIYYPEKRGGEGGGSSWRVIWDNDRNSRRWQRRKIALGSLDGHSNQADPVVIDWSII